MERKEVALPNMDSSQPVQIEEAFPPEPALPAPGGDDECEESGNILLLDNVKQNTPTVQPGRNIYTTSTVINADFKPMHQRSISDHLLRYDQTTSNRAKRELSHVESTRINNNQASYFHFFFQISKKSKTL